LSAGYGKAYAQAAASRVGKIPSVKKALESIRAEFRSRTLYGLEEAVSEVDRAVSFAYGRSNPQAVAKLLELKSKLHGLLIERLHIKEEIIDLRGALDQARVRVRVINSPLAISQRAPNPFEGLDGPLEEAKRT
jgi:hypothetical protein